MNDHPVIIDCDTGRDDALSIWLCLAMGMNLKAVVASYGNTALENVSENCARVLALAGREDVSLWQGENFPLQSHKGVDQILLPKQQLSGNGLCNLELPRTRLRAVPQTAEQRAHEMKEIATSEGPISYVILGPATNFAKACEYLGDDARHVIANITMMGGKLDPLWDEMPGADFNLACDPYAVQALLDYSSCQGFDVRFVPMNVTWPIVLDMNQLEKLRSDSAVGQTAIDLMIAHARHFAPEPVFRFHDPCVILALLELDSYRDQRLSINCDEESSEFGRLTVNEQGIHAKILQSTSEMRAHYLDKILTNLQIHQNN